MFTITQRELLYFRRLARQTLGRKAAANNRTTLIGSRHSRRLLIKDAGIRLSYRVPNSTCSEPAAYSIPSTELRYFERPDDEPVEVRRAGDGTCILSSSTTSVDGVVTQSESPSFERRPGRSVQLHRLVLDDLAFSSRLTDNESSRLALHCLELNGSNSSLAATDGRQALRTTGCEWPWEDARLIRSTGWFASPLVSKIADDLHVTAWDDSIRWTVGLWSLDTPVEQGEFPDVKRVIPARWQADTVLRLTDEDQQAIASAVKSLPKPDRLAPNAITLEVGRPCVLRVTANDSRTCSEVVLPTARFSGLPLRAAVPRRAFKHIAQLGFDEIMATERAQTFFCRDSRRQFVFMPLHPDFAATAASQPDHVAEAVGS